MAEQDTDSINSPAWSPGRSGPRPEVPAGMPEELRRALAQEILDGEFGIDGDGRIARIPDDAEDPLGESSIYRRSMEIGDDGLLEVNGLRVRGGDSGDTSRTIPGPGSGKRLVTVFSDVQAEAFDLADPVSAAAYAKVLSDVSSSRGALVILDGEPAPSIFPNPSSPRGFSSVVTLKWARPVVLVVDESPHYEEISREELERRFPGGPPKGPDGGNEHVDGIDAAEGESGAEEAGDGR